MKVVRIALAGFAALSILLPVANAQQKTTTVALVQKLQPAARSYPGVSTDMLGIRIGMTVSQAEAIAAKSYPGKPQEYKVPDTYSYKEVTAQSQPFVLHVAFTKQTAHTSDTLTLNFSSPVTGNTLLGMTREIKFGRDSNSALSAPLVSTLKASLIKKYGPASWQSKYPPVNPSDRGQSDTSWVFTQKSLITCTDYCGSEGFETLDSNLTGFGPAPADPDPSVNANDWSTLNEQCGGGGSQPFVFFIWSHILKNPSDNTKAANMTVAMGDTGTCIDDGKEATSQLRAAAIKFYNTVSKAPAAPKL